MTALVLLALAAGGMNAVAWAFFAPAVVIGCLLLVGGLRKARHLWRARRNRKAAENVARYEAAGK